MSNAILTQAIATTASIVGTRFDDVYVETMARKLRQYPEADVLAALDRCLEEVKGHLALKDVLGRMPNQPLGADAAWSKAIEARIWEEGQTVVIEEAIFQAFPFALYDDDKVAARMAFKDAYPQELVRCGNRMKVVKGWNAAAVRPALQAAVDQGLLPLEAAAKYLPREAQPLTAPGLLLAEGGG